MKSAEKATGVVTLDKLRDNVIGIACENGFSETNVALTPIRNAQSVEELNRLIDGVIVAMEFSQLKEAVEDLRGIQHVIATMVAQ